MDQTYLPIIPLYNSRFSGETAVDGNDIHYDGYCHDIMINFYVTLIKLTASIVDLVKC